MWVHHPGMLEALAAKGAQVPEGQQRARMSEALIDEVVGMQLPWGLVPDRSPARSSDLYFADLGFEIAPLYYDFDLGRARPATHEDLANMAKLGQMLPQVRTICAPLTLSGVSPLLEPFESFLTLARLTDKPIGASSLIPAHHPYFAELGQILYGQPGYYIHSGAWMTSPLCISERAGELFRLAPQYGHTTADAGTMVIAGLSGPITTAGAIVVGAAEILGTWIGALAVQPGLTGFSGHVATGVLDPRTSRGSFGGPEPILQDLGICELFDHCFGGGIGMSGLGYTDGKVPGLQVSFEKVTKSLAMSRTRGLVPRISSPGLLDAGRAFSPVQYLIDLEMDRCLWHLHRELDVSAEGIGLDTILEATAQYGSSFIGLEHTARHMRDLWLPTLMDRTVNYPPPDRRLEGRILEAANARWKELVSAWQPVERPELASVEQVIERARQELPRSGAATFVA